jgi:signal transduction histidine kinase
MIPINNLDFISVGVTIAAIAILGFMVLSGNRKSATSRAFFFMAIMTIFYGVSNYVNYKIDHQEIAFWFLRFTIFFAVWHAFSIFNLFYAIPKERVSFPRAYKFILVPLVIFVSVMTLTPLVFESVFEATGTRITKVNNGPGVAVFGTTIITLVFASIFHLISKIRQSTGRERKQLYTIFIGAGITFILLTVFNFIFPVVLQNSRFVPLGAMFMLPFIVFTFYAILRQGFLRIKVVATEILAFALAVITLVEAILSETTSALIFRSGIFFLVLAIGIVLIKSVLKEVEQREALELLTNRLEMANSKLTQLDKLKSEFLSFASHQVKSPMSVVKGFAQLIHQGVYGQVPDKVRDTAKKIEDSANRLISLVNNLLDLRKIEEGKIDCRPEKMQLVAFMADIVEGLKPLADDKNLELTWESKVSNDTNVNIDKQKFYQVIQNIIDNAIKYTEKGYVKVTAYLPDGDSKSVIIEVSDSGHGIDKDLLPNLFEQFTREESMKRKIEGTGLGLYIAKKIVDLHSGEIWAQSEGKGKGSSFFVKIPIVM